MTELSEAAKILLRQMATNDYATLAVIDTGKTPPVISELIGLHAIHILEGGHENEVRCQITKQGLDLYRSRGQSPRDPHG